MTSSPVDPDETTTTAESATRDEAVASGRTTDEAVVDAAVDEEKAWWDNPAMPWKGKPGRADLGCMGAITGMGIWGLVQLPLKPVLLTLNPYVLAAVSGGSITMAMIGALARVDGGWWWVFGLVLGTLSVIKFDWIFWWAGKLWGDGLIDYLLQGRGGGARKRADRAVRLTHKYETLALAVTYVPLLPIPGAIIYGALGAAGTSLRKFLLLDVLFALVSRGIYMFLGYQIGQPAVDVLRKLGDYSWYLSIALLVVVVVSVFWRNSRKQKSSDQPS